MTDLREIVLSDEIPGAVNVEAQVKDCLRRCYAMPLDKRVSWLPGLHPNANLWLVKEATPALIYNRWQPLSEMEGIREICWTPARFLTTVDEVVMGRVRIYYIKRPPRRIPFGEGTVTIYDSGRANEWWFVDENGRGFDGVPLMMPLIPAHTIVDEIELARTAQLDNLAALKARYECLFGPGTP